jgi:hypothetical protein
MLKIILQEILESHYEVIRRENVLDLKNIVFQRCTLCFLILTEAILLFLQLVLKALKQLG